MVFLDMAPMKEGQTACGGTQAATLVIIVGQRFQAGGSRSGT